MAVPTTWATAVDVKDLTGKTVSDGDVAAATAVIELTSGGRLARLDADFTSARNLDWLRRAVAYQAAFMVSRPDYFDAMDVASLNQDGVSVTFRRDSLHIAPLARRCLKRLSWRGVRTITPSVNRTTDRPGSRTGNAPDLPDVPAGMAGAYLADDDLNWGVDVIANTWAAVYRDTDDDVLGDPQSDETPVAGLERVVMAITERAQRIFDAESDELRTVRYGVGRARPGTDIRKDDRLHDLRSGKWWAVREVLGTPAGVTGFQDLSFDLRAS